jgi:DNA-binding SARP family transcriptional activator
LSSLKLLLLGSPQIERDGAPVEVDTRKAIALIAYLALTGQIHSREALAARFWPEYDQDRAYANLRRTLWSLNKAIGKEWLDVDKETIALRRGAGFWLDVDACKHIGKERTMSEEKVRTEELRVNGDELLAKVKELVHEGNIRRIIIKNEDGKTLIDIPLTVGVVGALVAPQLVALGAIAAVVTHGTILVEKVEE